MTLQRETFGEEIGVSHFIFQSPDGLRREVTLRVGKPYSISSTEWACPVELNGFEPRYPDIRGGDSMQALCLAVSLVRRRMEDFLSKNGKVFDVDDGSEWDTRMLSSTFGDVARDGTSGS